MNETEKDFYDKKFYEYTFVKSSHSADRVTGIITNIFHPNTICDVGCGEAVWLASYKRNGVESVTGIDGQYVNLDRLYIPRENFIPCDLAKPFKIDGKFDVVQSLEVAEHLPLSQSEHFIDNLTGASDVVVFSAAVCGQGGMYHINEQPLQYWRTLFRVRGYSAYDIVRPVIANDKKVAPWYRYNLLVYVSDNASPELLEKIALYKVLENQEIRDVAPLWYNVRCKIISFLPFATQQFLAKLVS